MKESSHTLRKDYIIKKKITPVRHKQESRVYMKGRIFQGNCTKDQQPRSGLRLSARQGGGEPRNAQNQQKKLFKPKSKPPKMTQYENHELTECVKLQRKKSSPIERAYPNGPVIAETNMQKTRGEIARERESDKNFFQYSTRAEHALEQLFFSIHDQIRLREKTTNIQDYHYTKPKKF